MISASTLYHIPLLIIVLFFCYATVKYIYHRYSMANFIREQGGDLRSDEDYVDISSWLKLTEKQIAKKMLVRTTGNLDQCKTMALHVPPEGMTEPSICNLLGEGFCGKVMKKITIPPNHASEFYTTNGTRLLPGESYCVYKQPPLTDSFHCDEVWGFWQYHPAVDRWICKSKVPGIYNSANNSFDVCRREDPAGEMLFDGEPLTTKDVRSAFTPEDFFSEEFQKRVSCRCSRGFVFRPDISRSMCFMDPCVAGLPVNAAAEGYQWASGTCECGDHFVNMYRDARFPCTACPYNFPTYDEATRLLTVFVKCYDPGHERGGQDVSLGLFPCTSHEDKARGCMRALIRVKAIPTSKKPNDQQDFEDRIFF